VEEACHIKEVAEKFYKNLLGSNDTQFDESKEAWFLSCCIKNLLVLLQAWIGKSLIKKFKKTLFTMNGSKAPGHDGFPTVYSWEGVYGCCKVIFPFLGNSLKTNATIPTLVPKRPNPSMMGDFRPIGANVPQRSILENAYPKTYQQQIVEVWMRRCWLK
jgi:hypothetical protein